MILVCGATGTVGSEVVKQLWRAHLRCKAMVHAEKRADFIRFPGVEIVEADFAEPETLGRALADVDRVYLVAPPQPQQLEFESNVIQACQQAGVQYIVKQSIVGAEADSPVPYCQWNGQSEQQLKRSGIPWTILQPNYFMQNLLRFADEIVSQGVLRVPVRTAHISQIDTRDVAAAAAACLTHERHRHRTYVLTGPQAVSFSGVAERLSAALGRPVHYQEISPAEAASFMREMGTPGWRIEAELKLAESYRRGEGSEVTDDVLSILGRPAISFTQFAQDYAPVFLKVAPGAQEEIRKAA